MTDRSKLPEASHGFSFVQETEPSPSTVQILGGDTWFKPSTGGFKIFNSSLQAWLSPGQTGGGIYGFSIGGYATSADTSDIQRIVFPFDSGVATRVGTLSVGVRGAGGGCNSSEHMFVIGGVTISTIHKFAFPFDSGTAAVRGAWTPGARYYVGGFNSSAYGYGGGGYGVSTESAVSRFAFPFDSGDSTNVGTLSYPLFSTSTVNSSSYGYWMNGRDTADRSFVLRVAFPFDSGTVSSVGNMSNSCFGSSAANSSSHGYAMGGQETAGTSARSEIDRITFPFDSGTGSNVGTLASNRGNMRGACNSVSHGYSFGGHDESNVDCSNIHRITFPFDSGVASAIGTLTTAISHNAHGDDTDFISQFI